jgi:hypothetical protein
LNTITTDLMEDFVRRNHQLSPEKGNSHFTPRLCGLSNPSGGLWIFSHLSQPTPRFRCAVPMLCGLFQ